MKSYFADRSKSWKLGLLEKLCRVGSNIWSDGDLELSKLCQVVEGAHIIGRDCVVSGLEYDSRAVEPGDLFFAVRGLKADGHDFAVEAVRRGASGVVAERRLNLPDGIVQVIVPDTREAMGRMSALFFGYPSRRLKMIGVTGTKGKTTTTYMIKSILEEAGHTVGLVGTIQNMIGQEMLPAKRTTPEAVDLQRLFAEMVNVGCSHVVMEVSSHAMTLKRTIGTEFDVAVLTNIARDHLDFHGTFEKYREAKGILFQQLTGKDWTSKGGQVGVINADDPQRDYFISKCGGHVITYGLSQDADITARDVEVRRHSVSFRLISGKQEAAVRLSFTGRFNIYNALAASGACVALGVGPHFIKAGLESLRGVPGRFEPVDCGQTFSVIVDYAHTPESLENVLRTAADLSDGRKIVVFGCGGDRDKGKRPLMGQIAARYADQVIITSDNPRGEDLDSIARQIEEGLLSEPLVPPYEIILDRREAISKAVRLAEGKDIVIIAGKGHETYQEFAGHTVPFDDREEARKALRERLQHGESNAS